NGQSIEAHRQLTGTVGVRPSARRASTPDRVDGPAPAAWPLVSGYYAHTLQILRKVELMRLLPPPFAYLALAGILTAGLVSCGAPADTDTSSATSPAAAAEASDGGGADTAAEIPPEFTAPVGDDFVLGVERVD